MASPIPPLSETSARLVANAREARDDDARWLLVAHALAAERNPLGEYIELTIRFRRGDFSVLERSEALAREWRRRFGSWARIFAWWNIGLVLTVRDLESVFAHIDDLRAIGLPLVVEISRGSDAPDVCTFDEAFTRIAWMRKQRTVENASWGPGLGEETHHFRDVIVWRVADRAELFVRRGIGAEWIAVELRRNGLYAIGAGLGAELIADELILELEAVEVVPLAAHHCAARLLPVRRRVRMADAAHAAVRR